jgi:V/A-type H+-transporting ATPase subunit E
MTGLDRLIKRIEDESRQRAEEIAAAAVSYEARLLEQTRLKALEDRRLRLERNDVETALLKERYHSSAQLSVRNDMLRAKQNVIEAILVKAQQHLSDLSGEAYFYYIKAHLLMAVKEGDEILRLNRNSLQKLPKDFLDQFNMALVSHGLKGQLCVVESEIEDGFILSRGGVDLDFTFRAILDHQREDLEAALAKQLFEGA